MSAPGNTGRRAGRKPGKRSGYVSHEDQLRALVAHMRRRDRQLARAIVTVLSTDARTLGAFGVVLAFVEEQARSDGGAR
ncbi:MAG TPA: hypothetical protein VN253_29570 [Kofleriaceae bacterium]|nr:hypothetical protein [Kofleriaceae bacterium]